MKKSLLLILITFAFSLKLQALSMPLLTQELSLAFIQNVKFKNRYYSALWKSTQKWKGFFCNGFASYHIQVKGKVANIEVQAMEDASVMLYLIIDQNQIGLSGYYQSKATLCTPLGMALKAWIDKAYLKTKVKLALENQKIKIKLRIHSLFFDGLDFKKWWVPYWLEKYLLSLLNHVSRKVWSSFIGRWIEEKVAQIIEKQLENKRTPFTIELQTLP